MNEAQLAVARLLRRQARWCRRLGSPLYAGLLERSAGDVETGGPAWAVLAGHEDDPAESALALRLMGAVHRLVLEGRAPDLARHYYPSAGRGGEPGDAWPALRATLERHRDELHGLVERPVQTNEVGRSAALLGGFLLVARETGLPLRLLELGASAGLNLRWDHYRYESGEVAWGDPASPVRVKDAFQSGQPPLGAPVRVVERGGCDIRPLDPGSDEGRLTLLSYVWADQQERLSLLRGAMTVASRVPVRLQASGAADYLAAQLTREVRDGIATVVFHSIFTQYLRPSERERLRDLFDEAGDRASKATPLARLSLEPGGRQAEVRLTTWPGAAERLLATSGFHGRPVRWLDAGHGSDRS